MNLAILPSDHYYLRIYENLIPRPHCLNAHPSTQWKTGQ